MIFKEVGSLDCLTYSSLSDLMQVNSICYVVNVDSGVSKTESPFLKIFVRTVDDVVMPVFIFNVVDFMKTGLTVNSLKSKYIKVAGRASLYNGRFSIVMDSCSVVTGSEIDGLDEIFQKRLPGIDENFEMVNETFQSLGLRELPKVYKMKRYTDLYEGAMGGLVVYLGKAITHLSSLVSDEDLEISIKVFYRAVMIYEKILMIKTNSNLVTTADKLELIGGLPNETFEDKLVVETVSGLIKLAEPNHIIPVMITMASDLTVKSSSMYAVWKSLMPGGIKECQGYQLLKY